MVDDKFRSYRNHDTVAREGSEQTSPGGIGNLLAQLARLTGCDPCADGGRGGASSAVDNRDSVAREGSEQTSRGGIGDLLAELARLTGQGDPYADDGRDGASSALDWAADDASPGQRPSALSSEPAACAALSSARSACAFAAFSPSLAWVQALAQNTPPPSQRCLKDAPSLRHFLQPSTSSPGRRRSSAQFASDCHSLEPRNGSGGFCFFSLGPITVILIQIRLQRSER